MTINRTNALIAGELTVALEVELHDLVADVGGYNIPRELSINDGYHRFRWGVYFLTKAWNQY